MRSQLLTIRKACQNYLSPKSLLTTPVPQLKPQELTQESEIYLQSRAWQRKAGEATAGEEMEEVTALTFGHVRVHHL